MNIRPCYRVYNIVNFIHRIKTLTNNRIKGDNNEEKVINNAHFYWHYVCSRLCRAGKMFAVPSE